jgi:hypothetical protein
MSGLFSTVCLLPVAVDAAQGQDDNLVPKRRDIPRTNSQALSADTQGYSRPFASAMFPAMNCRPSRSPVRSVRWTRNETPPGLRGVCGTWRLTVTHVLRRTHSRTGSFRGRSSHTRCFLLGRLSLDIDLPLKFTPSSMEMRWAAMSPVTMADCFRSTRSLA